MRNRIKKLIGVFLAFAVFMTIFSENVVSISAVETETTAPLVTAENAYTDEQLENFVEPEYVSQFTFPDYMKAVALTPTVDFAKKIITETETGTVETEPDAEQISLELDEIMANISSLGMNTVIIYTSYNGQAFYSDDINDTVTVTPVEQAIAKAKENGFFVYLVFDINFVLTSLENKPLQDRIDYLAIKAHYFTAKNRVDGILLNGYYSSKSKTSLNDYMQNGSGIGFENWLMDNGAYVFSLVSNAIRKTNNTVPVGIYISDVWSNYTTNEKGSQTFGQFEALADGYADTLAYVQYGYADFIMLDAQGAISDDNIPFEELVRWWANYAVLEKLPFYVMHNNQKVYTDEKGWSSLDQVVKQLLITEKVDGYKGSAFKSYNSLVENVEES
ncbi:MAG: hypothetical protein ACI4KH_05460, partial [Oscillospiraceae bacterium]